MSQHGGAVAFRVHYYRCDRQGNIREDLSAHMSGGAITWNADQDTHHGELRCTCTQGGLLTPLEDYLRVSVDLAWADGTEITGEPLGIYRVAAPAIALDGHGRTDEIVAYDLVADLATARIADPVTVAAGADPAAYIATTLAGLGFAPWQWAGPQTARPAPATAPFEAGASQQEIIDTLLGGIGHYHVWMTRQGALTSAPSLTLAQRAATAAYTAGDLANPGTIMPGARGTPDLSGLCNMATVRNIVPGQEPIWYTAVNNDPASPVGIPALGVIARPPEDNSQLTTMDEARAQAEMYVSQGASYLDSWEIATWPDPLFDLHDVVDVTILAPDGSPHLAGAFWRRGLTFPLSLDGWQSGMRHTLSRIVPFALSGSGGPA